MKVRPVCLYTVARQNRTSIATLENIDSSQVSVKSINQTESVNEYKIEEMQYSHRNNNFDSLFEIQSTKTVRIDLKMFDCNHNNLYMSYCLKPFFSVSAP